MAGVQVQVFPLLEKDDGFITSETFSSAEIFLEFHQLIRCSLKFGARITHSVQSHLLSLLSNVGSIARTVNRQSVCLCEIACACQLKIIGWCVQVYADGFVFRFRFQYVGST